MRIAIRPIQPSDADICGEVKGLFWRDSEVTPVQIDTGDCRPEADSGDPLHS
jgi:hypothetical protein